VVRLPLIKEIWWQALDRIKCRVLEGVEAADVRVLVLDMQGRLMLDMLGRGIEAALMIPSTLIAEPWQASSETLTGLGVDAMAVDPALIPIIQVCSPLIKHKTLWIDQQFSVILQLLSLARANIQVKVFLIAMPDVFITLELTKLVENH
jgi:hypothetical protein